jgi:hypothetical protein
LKDRKRDAKEGRWKVYQGKNKGRKKEGRRTEVTKEGRKNMSRD